MISYDSFGAWFYSRPCRIREFSQASRKDVMNWRRSTSPSNAGFALSFAPHSLKLLTNSKRCLSRNSKDASKYQRKVGTSRQVLMTSQARDLPIIVTRARERKKLDTRKRMIRGYRLTTRSTKNWRRIVSFHIARLVCTRATRANSRSRATIGEVAPWETGHRAYIHLRSGSFR
jgi:hypothetical protein